MLAVIKTGGKQYTVREKQTLRIEKLPQSARTENKAIFAEVLLVSDESNNVTVGKPTITNARVEATILHDGKGEKVRVVKYKPKVRYRRAVGHRQQFTEVQIDTITV